MKKDDAVRVNFPGTSIHEWPGVVTDALADGSAGWVQFEQDLPVSLRSSTKDARRFFLTQEQVEAV